MLAFAELTASIEAEPNFRLGIQPFARFGF